MTDKQLNDSLVHATAEFALRKFDSVREEYSTTMTYAAALIARNAWAEFINKANGALDQADDATCKELAAAYTALTQMVDRSAALKETSK